MSFEELGEYLRQASIDKPTKTTIQVPTQQKYRITGFYKETRFQETPIGKIPKEWQVVMLKDVVKVMDKYRVPVREQDRKPGPYPYCGANGIIDYVDGYTHDGEFVLLAEDGGFFGSFEKSAYIMRGKFWANNHVHVLKPLEGKIVSEFLMYYLNFADLRPFLTGSTRPKLTQSDMLRIPLPLPSLGEQWGIAEVLSSVDQAIEATERFIEKLEKIRRDLMQELLTKGIGHKEFKETEVGKIPKDWQVVMLTNIAKITMGQSPPSSTYNENGVGVPFLQGKAEFRRIYPKPTLYTSKPLKIAEKDDLLISVRAPVGDVNIAPFRLCIGRGLASIRFNPNKASTLFYFYYFQTVKPRLEAIGKGSTFKAITREDLEKLLVPLPPLAEQQRIASMLKWIDDWIEVEEERKERLERLKRGLMDLLLTGRVRVKVLLVG